MPSRDNSYTPLADKVKTLMREQIQPKGGWSAARFAHEMNLKGHTNWTVPVVTAAQKERFLTGDEMVAILGIFKGNAQLLLKQIDEIAALIVRNAGKDYRP